MRYGLSALSLLALASISPTYADDIPALTNMSQYMVGAAMDSRSVVTASGSSSDLIERPNAVSGTSDLIVAPVFAGNSAADQSYLRLANPTATSAIYTIRVVGSRSGQLYGTTTYTVPAYASPQYLYSDILSKAGVTSFLSTDTSFAFYLSSSNSKSGYQHVIYNGTNRFFENVSMCSWSSTIDYTALNRAVVNAHTTQISTYPSSIILHNFASTSGTYNISVYEAVTGTKKGTLTVTALANSSYAIPVESFQTELGWQPSASEFHANFVVEPAAGTTFNLLLGQMISNQSIGATLNMSQICGLNSGAVPTGTTLVTADVVTSRISGDFNGWSGDTAFVLQNGQVWQQSSYAYTYSYKLSPSVTITKTNGIYKMAVDGVSSTINVERLK